MPREFARTYRPGPFEAAAGPRQFSNAKQDEALAADLERFGSLVPGFTGCRGEGRSSLASPGRWIWQGSVSLSGEIRDGRGYSRAATFDCEPDERYRSSIRRFRASGAKAHRAARAR